MAAERVSEIVLAEFNGWMAGALEYSDLSPAGQAYCDAYLDEYWKLVDALCEGASA